MSDTHTAPRSPYKPGFGRRRAHRPVSVEGLPTAEELAAVPHKGEAADRFTLYTPEQVDQETRNVRLDISFGDALKIRDQAEMIIAALRVVIEITRKHDVGSIRQRIETRREADSLRRVLARFNGKQPHGDTYRKR